MSLKSVEQHLQCKLISTAQYTYTVSLSRQFNSDDEIEKKGITATSQPYPSTDPSCGDPNR